MSDNSYEAHQEWLTQLAKTYGLEKPGELQWKWRQEGHPVVPDSTATHSLGPWWRELEHAICDALAMGSHYAYPGDGVACVAQIVWTYAKVVAEVKAEERLREANPAAKEAYEAYQILLKLGKTNGKL